MKLPYLMLAEKKGYFRAKRWLDMVLSFIGIVILSPIFIIVALAVKLTEPKAPVFFKQVRVGKNMVPFTIYKFRTMVTDAEGQLAELLPLNEVEGAMFKLKNDPRVTKIGRFLRKTSLDELPQLFNVLKGDMSLVGPRPPLESEVAQYTSYEKQRLNVLPGCTGVWQVTKRNSARFSEMVELDLFYIKNMSLSLDLKVIFQTILIMVVPNHAY
ncbi:sugar transferase [Listeria sp. PSOL-1]|uniref:sugar transferase n=1 Tax=Listeria sp. PSOL-1 TaxID=1844999 RepID=UPI001E37790B|nr:sugar transferase [Listeria sp. PSOL-1]